MTSHGEIRVNVDAEVQCRIKVGAIDAAALGPFVKKAHGADGDFFLFSWLRIAGVDVSASHHSRLQPALL